MFVLYLAPGAQEREQRERETEQGVSNVIIRRVFSVLSQTASLIDSKTYFVIEPRWPQLLAKNPQIHFCINFVI